MSIVLRRSAEILPLCLALGVMPSVSGCELFTEESCGTTKPAVHVDVTFRVLTAIFGQLGTVFVPGCNVNINTVKVLCDGDSKGAMNYRGASGEDGSFELTVGHNLSNTEDEIVITAEASCLVQNGLWEGKAQQSVSYSQAAAAAGGTLRENVYVSLLPK